MHKSFCSKIRKLLVYEVSWVNDLCIAGFLLEEYKKITKYAACEALWSHGGLKKYQQSKLFCRLMPKVSIVQKIKNYILKIALEYIVTLKFYGESHCIVSKCFWSMKSKEYKYEIKVQLFGNFLKVEFQKSLICVKFLGPLCQRSRSKHIFLTFSL